MNNRSLAHHIRRLIEFAIPWLFAAAVLKSRGVSDPAPARAPVPLTVISDDDDQPDQFLSLAFIAGVVERANERVLRTVDVLDGGGIALLAGTIALLFIILDKPTAYSSFTKDAILVGVALSAASFLLPIMFFSVRDVPRIGQFVSDASADVEATVRGLIRDVEEDWRRNRKMRLYKQVTVGVAIGCVAAGVLAPFWGTILPKELVKNEQHHSQKENKGNKSPSTLSGRASHPGRH